MHAIPVEPLVSGHPDATKVGCLGDRVQLLEAVIIFSWFFMHAAALLLRAIVIV